MAMMTTKLYDLVLCQQFSLQSLEKEGGKALCENLGCEEGQRRGEGRGNPFSVNLYRTDQDAPAILLDFSDTCPRPGHLVHHCKAPITTCPRKHGVEL